MNKIILVGNLTRDPEMSSTQSGVTLTRFSIAVNRTFVAANGERATDFFDIITWRQLAENCGKYLFKGSKVGVVGSMQRRQYEDKQGISRVSYEVVADEVEFLSPRSAGAEGGGGEVRRSAPRNDRAEQVSELTPVDDSDLPF